MNNKSLLISVLIVSFLTVGCVKETTPGVALPNGDEYFNFKINETVALSVDYGFPQQDYIVLAEVYDRYPMMQTEDGELVKQDIEPLYRGATDGSGKMTSELQLPSNLTKVWLYSEYPGTLSPVEVEVKNNRIDFNQAAYIAGQRQASSRAATGNKHTYPDSWLLLGDWDEYGTPTNLDAARTMPLASTLYNINEVYVKYVKAKLKDRYPAFFQSGLSSELHITKPTKIYLVFINSSAAWENTVGYFCYPTGQEPQKTTDIKRIVAFPSVTPYLHQSAGVTVRGALVGGDRMQLKYWDGERFHEEFPAGVSIGWWLEGMGFTPEKNLAIKNNGTYARYSLDRFNSDGERRMVALRDSKSDRVVAIGFEDNIDLRYNDATFYVEVDVDGAIEGNIPTLPDDNDGPADSQNYILTNGFLMYEDLWPNAGDYDMNDVMIKYSSKVYKHILNNSVYKVETEYTPIHKGGTLQSGFGVQFTDMSPDAVRQVTITGSTPSQYMEGQKLEPGQRYPTLILFDDLSTVMKQKITMTVDLNDTPESTVVPPFNPFIFAESNKMRGKEVHLVKYHPTDRADMSLFGKGKDGSIPQAQLYYVMTKNEKQYPFALNMPFVQEIPIPAERENIDITYPRFRSWVESGGKLNKDWYLYPAKK